MRYFDTETRAETSVQSSITIPMTDERVSWWFKTLDAGEMVIYDDNGLPHKAQVGQFFRPMVVDGVVVEGMSQNEIISMSTQSKRQEIESHIYSHYSEKKQSQDRGYQTYSQTVIVGLTSQSSTPTTLDALTIEVMGVVLQILEEVITLEDYVASKPIELQEHYKKLVKVGLRLKWTKSCIDEGKLAIAEGREPNYPIFPVFG